MPRILFLSIHHRGHINPVKELARELLRRGESDVSFATYDAGASIVSKDAMCGSLPVCRYDFISAGSTGMTTEEEADALKTTFDPSSPPHVVVPQIASFFTALQRSFYSNLLARVRAGPLPDLIVVDAATLGGTDIAEALGVPYVLVSSSLEIFLQGCSPRYAAFAEASWLPLVSIPYQ